MRQGYKILQWKRQTKIEKINFIYILQLRFNFVNFIDLFAFETKELIRKIFFLFF